MEVVNAHQMYRDVVIYINPLFEAQIKRPIVDVAWDFFNLDRAVFLEEETWDALWGRG
jgi:hypothetical protein